MGQCNYIFKTNKTHNLVHTNDPFESGKPFYFDHRIHNEEPTWTTPTNAVKHVEKTTVERP